MQNDTFTIRAYGKSELAMLYFPRHTQETAMRLLRTWLDVNPRLRHIRRAKGRYFTPKQVKLIVSEVGEPFDHE